MELKWEFHSWGEFPTELYIIINFLLLVCLFVNMTIVVIGELE